jgi:hypothetical protein
MEVAVEGRIVSILLIVLLVLVIVWFATQVL